MELAKNIPMENISLYDNLSARQLEINGISGTLVPQGCGTFGTGAYFIHQTPVKYSNVFSYDPLYDDDDEKDCKF